MVINFFETNLAYLMDDGLRIEISYINTYWVNIYLNNPNAKTWEELKDQMIPFLIRLKNNYQVVKYSDNTDVCITRFRDPYGSLFFNIDKLINDEYTEYNKPFASEYQILANKINKFTFNIEHELSKFRLKDNKK
jgi:hypothetical protein